jgi:hypothetical protein
MEALTDSGEWTALNATARRLLGLLTVLLALGLAQAHSASGAVVNPRFFEKVAVAPELSVAGEGLAWSAVDPTNSYVLRRNIPGSAPEYAIVKAISALPPSVPGQTVGYSVRSILAAGWSREVLLAYPPAGEASQLGGGLIGGTQMLELGERRFFGGTGAQPLLVLAGATLAWEAIDPSNSYVLRRKLPGRSAEYALVKANEALPAAIPGQTVGYSLRPALGSSWSAEVGITYASTIAPEEKPSAPSSACKLYAAVQGSDSNPGTLTSPLRTVKGLIRRLPAGATGCLKSGQTFNGSFTLYNGDSNGEPRLPVTITSTDPANPATIFGRVVTQAGANWLTFTALNFKWNELLGLGLPQITVGSNHTSWTHDNVENANTTICINTVSSARWGVAHYTLIDHDRIHDCGGPIPYSSSLASGYTSHGVYAIGYHTIITNNYIYHESSRGVLLRGSKYGVVEHNIIDDNGSGVGFGDLGASNNEVAYNIITNSLKSINGCCNVFGVFSWWKDGLVGTGNTFHNNCVWGNQQGNIETRGGGFTATENRITNPLYVNAAEHNYKLQPGSPCLGYGPESALP